MKKNYIVTLLLVSIVLGCHKNRAREKINDNKDIINIPQITYIKISDISKKADFCYNTDNFYSYLSNINNNGTIVGTIAVKSDTGDSCKNQSYYLTLNNIKTFMINSVDNPFDDDTLSIGTQVISNISSNNNSVGHTLILDADTRTFHDLANYNIGVNSTSILDYNYMYHISENGQYATFGNLGGQYGVIDITNSKVIDETMFDLNDMPMDAIQGMLVQVNNTGNIVGYINNQNEIGVFCSFSNKHCKALETDKSINSYLETISENSAWAYGFTNGNNGSTSVFYIKDINHNNNQLNPVMIKKLDNFIVLGIENTTDQGLVIVKSQEDLKEYLYLPSTDKIYSVPEIANNIKLDLNPQNTVLGNIHISPNGQYMLIETMSTTFDNKIMATVVYFPKGIEDFLEHN